MTTPHITLTWQGRGLRLVDLLDSTERDALLGAFSSERQFSAEHVKSDATEFIKYVRANGMMEGVDELMERQVWEKTLEGMGWEIATAMDGRLDVVRPGSPPLVRGTVPVGSRSVTQIACDFIQGLKAQGQHPEFPATQHSQKPIFVSREFAEYLRAINEPVRAFERDAQGDVVFIWPARHDEQVRRVLRDFRLVTIGANEVDGGDLAKVVAAKMPGQYAVWKAGLADQWRMMDSLRDVLLSATKALTSGAYSDQRAGGALSEGLVSFQKAFQALSEDSISQQITIRPSNHLTDVADKVVAAAMYLDQEAPVRQGDVHRVLLDGVDLSSAIARDIHEMVVLAERAKSLSSIKSLDAAMGLG